MPIARQKNLNSKKEVKKVVKKKTTKVSVEKKKAKQVGRNSDGTFSKTTRSV